MPYVSVSVIQSGTVFGKLYVSEFDSLYVLEFEKPFEMVSAIQYGSESAMPSETEFDFVSDSVSLFLFVTEYVSVSGLVFAKSYVSVSETLYA